MLFDFVMDSYDSELLKDMIPEIYRDGIYSGEITGVLTYDGCAEPDRLVGLCLVRVEALWQEIVWVALTENYDLPEYAADIIWSREEAAREKGELLGTFADFPQSEERMKLYFALAGFDIRNYEEDGIDLFRATRAYEIKKTNRLLARVAEL